MSEPIYTEAPAPLPKSVRKRIEALPIFCCALGCWEPVTHYEDSIANGPIADRPMRVVYWWCAQHARTLRRLGGVE